MSQDKQISCPIVDDLSNKTLQASNDCFVRFFRFLRRDTREHDENSHRPLFLGKESGAGGGIWHGRHIKKTTITDARELDVASDIFSCSVSKSKGSSTGSFEMVLASGDINYHHVLHPGDHCMIWMKRNRIDRIDKNRVDSKNYNNSFNSGFKMYGVVTDVRRIFRTSDDGKKILRYKISGEDVGHFFSAQVYYTAWLSDLLGRYGVALSTIFNPKQIEMIGSLTSFASDTPQKVDEIIPLLIGLYLGMGPLENYNKETLDALKKQGFADRPASPNLSFLVPSNVAPMFHRDSAQTIADLLHLRVGVENYTHSSLYPKQLPMEGWKILTIEAGNQQSVWNILQSYSNPSVNEMFIDLKPQKLRHIDFDTSGNVVNDINYGYLLYPTFVCRQIPFTSRIAKNAFDAVKVPAGPPKDADLAMESTSFVELPRIRIPESFIIQEDIGRGNHERFNFLEIYGVNQSLRLLDTTSQQVLGNFAIDTSSIHRYGLRTLIAKTDFQWPTTGNQNINLCLISKWIYLLTDWWLGAHTFESGTFMFAGIEEPISLGDNIEIIRQNEVNELYHIEAYQHSYGVESTGVGTFRTVVQVSRGQRVDEYPIYASGQFDEEAGLNIGFSDTEFEDTARPSNSSTSKEIATSVIESPTDQNKVNK